MSIEQYSIKTEPYYRTVSNEVELYEAAYSARMPVMLKGPTGCGKSRFVEYMAWKLKKPLPERAGQGPMTALRIRPLTSSCRGKSPSRRPATA